MAKQRAHQKAFLTYAFGGSKQYDGRYMRETYQTLDAVALIQTLKEMGVADDLIAEVAAPQPKKDVLN